jgi:hypothetical protein
MPAGQGFGLTVTVMSVVGQADTFYNGPVTIQLGANPGGSILSGNLTATADAQGLASFTTAPGRYGIRATRAGDVRTYPQRVLVR